MLHPAQGQYFRLLKLDKIMDFSVKEMHNPTLVLEHSSPYTSTNTNTNTTATTLTTDSINMQGLEFSELIPDSKHMSSVESVIN